MQKKANVYLVDYNGGTCLIEADSYTDMWIYACRIGCRPVASQIVSRLHLQVAPVLQETEDGYWQCQYCERQSFLRTDGVCIQCGAVEAYAGATVKYLGKIFSVLYNYRGQEVNMSEIPSRRPFDYNNKGEQVPVIALSALLGENWAIDAQLLLDSLVFGIFGSFSLAEVDLESLNWALRWTIPAKVPELYLHSPYAPPGKYSSREDFRVIFSPWLLSQR